MIKSIKNALGVTLLEILLVLVIASLIIVMSVRYYQSASSSSKVNSAMEILTGYMAAAESYISSGGAVSGITCSSGTCASSIAVYLPGNTASNSPWGTGAVALTNSGTQYSVDFGSVPGNDCTKLVGLLSANPNVTVAASCSSGSALADMKFNITP